MRAAIHEHYGMLTQFLPKFLSPAVSPQTPADQAPQGSYRVMVVEANVPLARLLATGITAESASVTVMHDWDAAAKHLERSAVDLLILDLEVPCSHGLTILRDLRRQHPGLGIVVLGGRAVELDMVNALNNGADDYLPKPFSLIEMMARVRALRRRSGTPLLKTDRAGTHDVEKPRVIFHKDKCSVERDGKLINLTRRECTLLEYMIQHEGETLSRSQLTQEVWNMPVEGNTNIVDVYVKYLRDKLDGDSDVKLIRTIRGLGYAYQA